MIVTNKNTISTLLLLLSIIAFAQKPSDLITSKVDNRVELLSIAFRLADAEEYSSDVFPDYVNEIEKHYGDYKDHDLIKYIKLIREENGIAYDAVMSFAISITEPPNMVPIIPFSETIPEKRWGKETALKFLNLLNQFYIDTNSEQFFSEHKKMYQLTSQAFEKVYENLNLQWYENFYGQEPKGQYKIINAVGIGDMGYGPKIILPNGKEVIYAIMGVSELDSKGAPKFSKDTHFPTVLHEINHSFVNHLIEKFKSELHKSGVAIYKPIQPLMRKQAYTHWPIMISEALVRASVIKYMKDNNSDKELIKKEIKEQLTKGFIWTENLVNELERYDNNRDKYPSMESFMPEIVKFFNQTALNIDSLMQKFDEKTPKVVSMRPSINDSVKVDHSIKKITFNFDQALNGQGYSINFGQKGKQAFPKIGDVIFSANRTSVTMEVSLEPNKEYQFILTGLAFKSKDGYELADYEVYFKTK